MYILAVGIIVSYLVGSIPTAYIIGRILKNIDIRQHGSGNVGATNVFRVLGKGPGIVALLLDIYKGFWVVAIAAEVLGLVLTWERIVLAIVVVLGHNYTLFLKFKGGKGVATSLGVLFGFMASIPSLQIVVVLTLAVFLASFLISRYVSFSSIAASIALPVVMMLSGQPIEMILLGFLFCLFVVYRHQPNIKRLMTGQEPKVPLPFSKSKKS